MSKIVYLIFFMGLGRFWCCKLIQGLLYGELGMPCIVYYNCRIILWLMDKLGGENSKFCLNPYA